MWETMAKSISEMLKRRLECDAILKCVLGLKHLDLEAYKVLLNQGPFTAEKLGEILGRERSTAYRALQNLIHCGLVYRETRTIESGGYYYEYSALSPTEVKEIAHKCVEEWYERMNQAIEELEENLGK